MKTPGYHRYMRGTYFFFGMLFALFFHSLWWLLVVAAVVVIRAVYDIWHEEEEGVSYDIPYAGFRTEMNWDKDDE